MNHYGIGAIVLVALAVMTGTVLYPAYKSKRASELVMGMASSTAYINQNVSFYSPQQLIVNVNSNNQFILSAHEASSTSFIGVYVGKPGDCYMDICKQETKRTEVDNHITWEFLGNPEHCDGKECSLPSALYRTATKDKVVFLMFFEYGPPINKEAILSTFVINKASK